MSDETPEQQPAPSNPPVKSAKSRIRRTTFRLIRPSMRSVLRLVQGAMRIRFLSAMGLLGLSGVLPVVAAAPQDRFPAIFEDARLSNLSPPPATLSEIEISGLRHIPRESVKARLSVHTSEAYDLARIFEDVRTLSRLGWFQDISVHAERVDNLSVAGAAHVRLEFCLVEYPFLTDVAYRGSKLLSQQQIKKLLEEKKLTPQPGRPANPVTLHRVRLALQQELAASGHRDARVLITQEPLPGQRTAVTFVIDDGPRQPVVRVNFSGHPEVPDKTLRKQMREIDPNTWLSGFRYKNVYTQEKGEAVRANLLTYLQNHGFPQARVGTPDATTVPGYSMRSLPWLRRQTEQGLIVDVPVEAGPFYRFGPTEVSAALRQSLGSASKPQGVSSNVAPGRPFSQHAVQSLQRNWEMRLHHYGQQHQGAREYRLRPVSRLDSVTHLATVKFDFDPAPAYAVRRVNFQGNRRFPDRYLRRRIGLMEGQPFDEYALEAGLARIARTGYFDPFKKEDIQVTADDFEHAADVTIRLREKGKQRLTFSGGREQFGSTLGIAYTIFNLLGMDEFLATQIDGGPETLQLAMSFAKEGFLGSRGTLALSVFDTFIRPRFATTVQGPFLRAQTEGLNVGWTFAISDADAIGINYGISRSATEYELNTIPANSTTPANARTDVSAHSLAAGWLRYAGNQKIQMTDSVSGAWLGGSENLLKSKLEYGHIFSDGVFDQRNSWAFRTTVSAAGSYQGDMPVYARFLSGEDLVRGLRPGELGPFGIFETISSPGSPRYSAVASGANLVAASNMEYRFRLTHGVEAATFFDSGSGLLLPNWLGPTRPALLGSTNGVLHASSGVELRWTLPGVGVPLRLDYSFNVLRLNRIFSMPDGSLFRVRNRFGALGWGFGSLF